MAAEQNERAQLASELHTQVVQAVCDINKRFYEVASLVKEINDKRLYKELGYTSIQQYLSAIGAGLSYAKLRLGARIIEGILEKLLVRKPSFIVYDVSSKTIIFRDPDCVDIEIVPEILDEEEGQSWSKRSKRKNKRNKNKRKK